MEILSMYNHTAWGKHDPSEHKIAFAWRCMHTEMNTYACLKYLHKNSYQNTKNTHICTCTHVIVNTTHFSLSSWQHGFPIAALRSETPESCRQSLSSSCLRLDPVLRTEAREEQLSSVSPQYSSLRKVMSRLVIQWNGKERLTEIFTQTYPNYPRYTTNGNVHEHTHTDTGYGLYWYTHSNVSNWQQGCFNAVQRRVTPESSRSLQLRARCLRRDPEVRTEAREEQLSSVSLHLHNLGRYCFQETSGDISTLIEMYTQTHFWT